MKATKLWLKLTFAALSLGKTLSRILSTTSVIWKKNTPNEGKWIENATNEVKYHLKAWISVGTHFEPLQHYSAFVLPKPEIDNKKTVRHWHRLSYRKKLTLTPPQCTELYKNESITAKTSILFIFLCISVYF